jgi:hypothetical protein
VSNALGWFTASHGELRESLAAGSVTEVELPAPGRSQGDWLLRAPDGRTRPLPRGAARATIGPLDRCGIWSVSARGKPAPELELACNLASAQESDIRPAAGLETRAARAGLALGGHPVWFYLIAAAWGLATLEWFLYQRRWIS